MSQEEQEARATAETKTGILRTKGVRGTLIRAEMQVLRLRSSQSARTAPLRNDIFVCGSRIAKCGRCPSCEFWAVGGEDLVGAGGFCRGFEVFGEEDQRGGDEGDDADRQNVAHRVSGRE